MEISITAVTRNRKFTKSLVRHSIALAKLEKVASHVNTSKLSFDILQLVFGDKDDDYVKAVGCKGDRLFQIEVAIPNDKIVPFENQQAFLSCIANRLTAAVKHCGLPREIESLLEEAIKNFDGV